MKWFLLFFVPLSFLHSIDLSKHLKKIEPLSQPMQIQGIECIYLINLDWRPEKLRACMNQLHSYNIVPYRFSAVVGRDIPEKDMKEVGLKFKPGMEFFVGRLLPGPAPLYFFNERMYGKTCFYKDFNKGALGCTLSHLSILQHAYDSGYQTIWVLEDDFLVMKDPHILSEYIRGLDEWIGVENWDILHTDNADYFTAFGDRWRPDYAQISADFFKEHPEINQDYKAINDPHISESERLHAWWIKRINKAKKNYGMTRSYPDVHPDFRYISGRYFTHSMIIKRSGMKKILDFEKKYGIFLPYDDEISVIPFLKMFNLKSNVVTMADTGISDTGLH